MSQSLQSNHFRFFSRSVRIEHDDPTLTPFILGCYSSFSLSDQPEQVDLVLRLSQQRNIGGWALSDENSTVDCDSIAAAVFSLEKMLTIDLQKLRTDLFFVHAAAISRQDRCTLVIGQSGAGKSTLCLDLCNENYAYMSDELAPIAPDNFEVEAYPHAICLKAEPDASIVDPEACLRTSETIHIPVEYIPSAVQKSASRLQNVVFLTKDETVPGGIAKRISNSEAAARLYANGLNQLAHANEGLGTAAEIVSRTNCFLLNRGSRPANLAALTSILEP